MTIRDLSSDDLRLYADIVVNLKLATADVDLRQQAFFDIVKLVRADTAVSYMWDDRTRRSSHPIIHNMDPANLARYEAWYQYRDPITYRLRGKKRAAAVEQVMPYRELRKTEFYNDFLRRDGHHHGINLFVIEDGRDLGDFRLWRNERSPDFTKRELMLLDALAPYLRTALSRETESFDELTRRERDVVALVCKGLRDHEIASALKISFSTVRTHLNKAMAKKDCTNRAELAAVMASRDV